jgi:hypothetical protein
MRERAQASVETIALTAAALALAAALLLGVVRFGPSLAATLGQALSGVFSPRTPTPPGLDGLERALLGGATSADADGPTLLDLRTHLRSRLDRPAADAAFAAILRPLVAEALAAHSIPEEPDEIAVVDRASEDAWLRDRFHPGRLQRASKIAVGFAGLAGAMVSLADDLGLATDEPVDSIEPGRAAGDIVVGFGRDFRRVILRREPGSGLVVIADRGSLRDGGS